jgi:rRNA maturation endonuclease Nob1
MIVHEFTCLDCNAVFEESASVKDTFCLFCGSKNLKKSEELQFKGKGACSHHCDDCSGCS